MMSPLPTPPSKCARVDVFSTSEACCELLLLEDNAASHEVTQVGHILDLEEIDEDEEGSSDLSTQLTAQSCAMSHDMASINRITINDRMLWNPNAVSKALLTLTSTVDRKERKREENIIR